MAEDPGGGGEKRIRRDYFSEEIISEILARLPVKSLLRFRCVCKSWCALIADSHFVKKHFSYAESGIYNNCRLLFLQNPPLSIEFEAGKKLYARSAIRELQFPVKFPVGYKINGALHWLVRGSRIVSFSVAEEKFEEMVPLLDHDRVFQGVLVYKDHLCVYEIKDGAPGFVSIWLMEEYGVKESWTRVIHFPLQKSAREEFRPLCILQNGEILMHRILYDVYDDPDPYEFDYHDPDEFDYHDPDEFEYPYPDPDEFDYPDPDPFDDPEVYDDPYKFDDPYEEFDYYDYNQEMWERKSILVLVDQTSWEYVFEVDLGFGAAIYKETLVSPLTAGSTADI